MCRPGLALSCRQFRLPRLGHRPDECQDASAADPERGRFAVADGATESVYAGEWARLLVDAFVGGDAAPFWPTWLPPLQARWEEVIRPPADAPPRPWYMEEALTRGGAFATFLGLVLEPSPDGPAPWRWQAHAVGDSCLFLVRRGELVLSFPLARSAEFGTTPRLVGSRRPPLPDDRRPGPVVPARGRGGRSALGRPVVLVSGRRPGAGLRRLGRRTARGPSPAQRRRDASRIADCGLRSAD